jgi:hypothetical protein
MDENELKAKAQEMVELLLDLEKHTPEIKMLAMKCLLEDGAEKPFEQHLRAFYAEHGRWPDIWRDPDGRLGVMGTKEKIDPAREHLARHPRPAPIQSVLVEHDPEVRAAASSRLSDSHEDGRGGGSAGLRVQRGWAVAFRL